MMLVKPLLLALCLVFAKAEMGFVTVQQFQELSDFVMRQASEIQLQASINQKQASQIQSQADEIQELKMALSQILEDPPSAPRSTKGFEDKLQNTTIEERVVVLEFQVADLTEEIYDLEQQTENLLDQQIQQDQRILNLEEDTDELDDQNEAIFIRLSSVEDTTGVQEGRIIANEANIEALEEEINGIWNTTGLHGANIEALQSEVGGLDDRLTEIEEDNSNVVAFHALLRLDINSNITFGAPVVFDYVIVNDGNGYNSTTGVFTVPPNGDGLYYFSTYFLVRIGKRADFYLRVVDGQVICRARGDHGTLGTDNAQAACSGLVHLTAGDAVGVIYNDGTDDLPVTASDNFTGFNGIKL